MGNWMADEVLWRAKLRPARLASTLNLNEITYLYNKTLFVAKGAMKSVGTRGGDPPKGWLFHVRWKNGLLCPKTKLLLQRESIGGRTTCWSPSHQN
jgi:formamidopyrimidine-DNA glycosylase